MNSDELNESVLKHGQLSRQTRTIVALMSQSKTLPVHRNFGECFADHGNFLFKAMFLKDAQKKLFLFHLYARLLRTQTHAKLATK